MKRFLSVMLALVMVLSIGVMLTGCSSDDSGKGTSTNNEPPFVFKANGTEVKFNQLADSTIEALGTPLSKFEEASCAFNGIDKTYMYQGFQLVTYPANEKDYISSVLIVDDSVSTAEGISIGSTLEEVKAAYGDASGDSALSYTRGDTTLKIMIADGKVSSIEYNAIPPESVLVSQ